MPKAMVTGATGFVGLHLCRELRNLGWDVQAIHRPTSSMHSLMKLHDMGVRSVPFETPVEIQKLAATTSPDIVFHLAAHAALNHLASDVDRFLESNIVLGTHLLEGLVGTGAVVVCASSYVQFRDSKPVAHSLYASTKQAFADISLFYRDRRGVDVRQVVLYDNFGPDDTRNKLVPQLLNAVAQQTPIFLGPLDQAMNLLYIDDLVAGLVAASGAGNPDLMTVRAVQGTTVGDIVNEVERVAQSIIDVSLDASRTATDTVAHSGEWPTPIGWVPQWTLSEGLKSTYFATPS